MNRLKLGKAPAKPRPKDLKFKTYTESSKLPAIPAAFGYDSVYPKTGWGMLGNDEQGDCAWASAAHETMLWTAAAKKPVQFTTDGVLADYHACTGPGDNGTDMHDEMNYRRQTGIKDSMGKRHKIGAFLSLTPGSLSEVYEAAYLFESVAIGIEFPESAMDQFNAGEMWSVVKGAQVVGGHAIPFIAKRTHLEIISWGNLVQMSVPFFQKYCDEAYAIVSPDLLNDEGLSARGFNISQLNADLTAL